MTKGAHAGPNRESAVAPAQGQRETHGGVLEMSVSERATPVTRKYGPRAASNARSGSAGCGEDSCA